MLAEAIVTTKGAEELAGDEDFWFRVRHAFTLDRNVINLNNGSISPSPLVVQTALRRYQDFSEMQPSLYVDEILIPEIELVRKRLAAEGGAHSEEIAVTRNTTESLESIQFGLDLKRGDEVLTTTQDYPSMIVAWQQRERRDGIVLKMVPFPTPPPSPDALTRLIEGAITPRTKVILISHITYTTGQIFPVRDICRMARSRGITTIVDGGHSFAQFPFRLSELECDYYGASLHKWLCAPIGTGLLYARRDGIAKVWPLFGNPKDMDANIRKFERIGTSPVANRSAISEALAFHQSIGVERKAARLRFLRRRWQSRAAQLPKTRIFNADHPEQSCALGAVSIAGIGAQKLTAWLQAEHKIHVRPRFVPGEFDCIRVTPHIYTTLEEIDRFSAALEEAATKGIA